MNHTNGDGTSITVLLERHRSGDADALDAVWPIVYAELKRIAQRQISGERGRARGVGGDGAPGLAPVQEA